MQASLVHAARKKRRQRVRKRLKGTSQCPRLSIFRSLNHLSLQVIDDEKGVTLAHCSTLQKDFKGAKKSKETAKVVGQRIAEIAIEKGIQRVVFDRGSYKYHGVIAQAAEAAREKGLKF